MSEISILYSNPYNSLVHLNGSASHESIDKTNSLPYDSASPTRQENRLVSNESAMYENKNFFPDHQAPDQTQPEMSSLTENCLKPEPRITQISIASDSTASSPDAQLKAAFTQMLTSIPPKHEAGTSNETLRAKNTLNSNTTCTLPLLSSKETVYKQDHHLSNSKKLPLHPRKFDSLNISPSHHYFSEDRRHVGFNSPNNYREDDETCLIDSDWLMKTKFNDQESSTQKASSYNPSTPNFRGACGEFHSPSSGTILNRNRQSNESEASDTLKSLLSRLCQYSEKSLQYESNKPAVPFTKPAAATAKRRQQSVHFGEIAEHLPSKNIEDELLFSQDIPLIEAQTTKHQDSSKSLSTGGLFESFFYFLDDNNLGSNGAATAPASMISDAEAILASLLDSLNVDTPIQTNWASPENIHSKASSNSTASSFEENFMVGEYNHHPSSKDVKHVCQPSSTFAEEQLLDQPSYKTPFHVENKFLQKDMPPCAPSHNPRVNTLDFFHQNHKQYLPYTTKQDYLYYMYEPGTAAAASCPIDKHVMQLNPSYEACREFSPRNYWYETICPVEPQKVYADDRDRMVYISWIPKCARACNAEDKRKMELELKHRLKEQLTLTGLTKVLLFPPKGVHCKLIFNNRKSASAFMDIYGGDPRSLRTEKWKLDLCHIYEINMRDKFDKTIVKIEWSQK